MNVGLLLHGSGWDELLMVAVGLVLAFLVITFTGRRTEEPEDEEAGAPAEAAADGARMPNGEQAER
jgi:hypothetical protein